MKFLALPTTDCNQKFNLNIVRWILLKNLSKHMWLVTLLWLQQLNRNVTIIVLHNINPRESINNDKIKEKYY